MLRLEQVHVRFDPVDHHVRDVVGWWAPQVAGRFGHLTEFAHLLFLEVEAFEGCVLQAFVALPSTGSGICRLERGILDLDVLILGSRGRTAPQMQIRRCLSNERRFKASLIG